ncbi:putative poly [ADP-ribose] polymerase, partial [Ixodes scapularis]
MPDDARLKSSTRQAFRRKRKRSWNKKPKLSAASAPPRSAPPDALDLPETSAGDIATPCSSGSLSSFASAVRVDTAYYSTAEQAQRVARSDECKGALSEKSATQRKFDLLGVTTGGQTRDAGTQFIVVDMKALNDLFAQAKCGSCGNWNSWGLHFKAQPRKYRPVQLEKRRSPPPRELPMNLSGPCPSRLPPPLQRLLRNLAEPELLARAPLSLGSEGQVALELLSQESLNTALALLEDIRQLVQEKASIQASAEQHQQESKLPELMLRIVEKSEELYCLIPVRGRRFERLEPLFEERGVQRMAALVHSLVHLQLATQLLLGAQLKAA